MPGDPQPRLPDFVIVGAPKSGTTSLAAWLGAREDVYVPPQKELHFFNRDDRWEQGAAWYVAQFADAGERISGEATPNYLDDPTAAARLAEVLPSARLIALLRDPVERAWSHYAYDQELGITDTLPFEDVVASAGTASEHRYISQGRYVQHLRRLAALVPREQLLVLWFDDLRDRPQEIWREVCGFLGIAGEPVPSTVGTVHNRHYRLRAKWVRTLMLRTRAWKRLPFGLAPRLDRMLRDEQGYDPIDPSHRDRLRATYAADDRDLADWLGRPLPSGWPR